MFESRGIEVNENLLIILLLIISYYKPVLNIFVHNVVCGNHEYIH